MNSATIALWARTAIGTVRGWWVRQNRVRRWLILGAGSAAAVLVIGGVAYPRGTQTTPTQEAELQTAVVRRGDLVISATGSGTLTAPEKDLGFTGSGDMRVTAVNVKAGDLVQQGEVLAQVDSTQTKQDYEEAQRAYAELTSISAQAAALRTVADAQTQVQRAKGTLEYLISPEVMYWETQITEGEDKLTAARTEVQKALGEAAAKAAADKAAAFLDFAQDKLVEAKKTYLDEYVPATFGIKDDLDVDTYNVPSELEIKKAHLAVTDAEKALADSQELYDALKNGTLPEDTTNAALLQIKKAQEQMKDAQANLDGSQIVAPYSGTVMSVSVTGGDVVSGDSSSTTSEANAAVSADPFAVLLNSGSDATTPSSSDETLSASGVIVLADTSEPYLEVYWSESDWPLLQVNNEVEITFDDRQDQVYLGKITEIDRELYTSFESTSIRGEVSLESPFGELGLPIGASASVEAIAQRADNAILVPIEALHKTDLGQTMVFVVQNGKVELRQVEVGLSSDTYAEIKSGLQAGEVVTTGTVVVQ